MKNITWTTISAGAKNQNIPKKHGQTNLRNMQWNILMTHMQYFGRST
jgi:hypothetical protein